MRKLFRQFFLNSFKTPRTVRTWLGFLSVGVLLLSIGMGIFSFFGRTNDTNLKFPLWAANSIKKNSPVTITMKSSITDDLGNRLGDTIAEKISLAGSLEEAQAQFKNPEELNAFVTRYLDQNMNEYGQSLEKDIARSINIRVQVKKNATQKEKENYLRTVRALVDPAHLPEAQNNSSLSTGETFYANLGKKLEDIKAPSEYYVIHHELIRAVKTKAIAYDMIASLDADPLKAALVMKILASLNNTMASAYRTLSKINS